MHLNIQVNIDESQASLHPVSAHGFLCDPALSNRLSHWPVDDVTCCCEDARMYCSWSLPGIGRDRSWNVSFVHEIYKKHQTSTITYPTEGRRLSAPERNDAQHWALCAKLHSVHSLKNVDLWSRQLIFVPRYSTRKSLIKIYLNLSIYRVRQKK